MEPDSQRAREISRRRFGTAALALGAGLTVAGCTTPQGSSGQAGSGKALTLSGKLSGTLSLYDHQSLSNATGKQMVADYEKLHPGVKVNIVSAPPAEVDTYVTTLMEGGVPPDLFVMATNMSPWQNVKDNWWVDLTPYAQQPDPYVPGNKRWTDMVQPGVLPTLAFRQGQMYSLTTTGFDVAFFYNKEIFAKTGTQVPRTWADLIAALEKFKSGGYIPFFCSLGELQYGDQMPGILIILEDTIMSGTIDRLNPSDPSGSVSIAELVRGIRDGVYSAKNEDYQECWKLFKSLAPYMQRGPASANASSIGLTAFETGKVATWWEGSFNAPQITNVEWGAFVLPDVTPSTSRFGTAGPQRKGAYGATAGYPFAIPTHTASNGHFHLAMDFVYWMTAPEQTSRYSALNGVLALDNNGSNPADMAPFVSAANSISRLTVAELALPQNFFITRSKLLEAYMLDQMSLGTAMAQMQSVMEQAAAQAEQEFGL